MMFLCAFMCVCDSIQPGSVGPVLSNDLTAPRMKANQARWFEAISDMSTPPVVSTGPKSILDLASIPCAMFSVGPPKCFLKPSTGIGSMDS